MATNLALDPALLDKVVAVSGEPTKKAAVGKLEWDASYDYKAERTRP